MRADLDDLLGERTKLVAFTHVSNVVGTIHDAAEVARRAHAVGAWVCVDGVAFAPHRRVDVRALDADFYLVSLYKVYGPHLALLYGKRERLRELRVSHRDLDYLIDRLQHDPMVDQLRIRRLKKRKLLIKDMIAALESELIPDLDA